jgi:hypothetical protein
MIRRYDMTRSDNAPVTNRCMMPVRGKSGSFVVYTPIKACTVVISPIRIPEGGSIMLDNSSLGKDNTFRVIYDNMPGKRNFVEFSFVVQ